MMSPIWGDGRTWFGRRRAWCVSRTYTRTAIVGFVVLGFTFLGCGESEPTHQLEVLRIALHGDPSSLDPHLQSEVVALSILGNIYDSLVSFDRKLRIVPGIAERWDNPDELTWRFYIRPNIKFHDGRPLSMDDIVYSLKRVQRHPASKQVGVLVAVDQIRRVGDSILELVTVTPYPILLNKLALIAIVPAGSPATIERPMGTGPYRFVGLSRERVHLEAVQDHWRRLSEVTPLVEYHFVSDGTARARGLLAGRYDVIDDVPLALLPEIEAHPGSRIEAQSSLLVTYLQMNPQIEPFTDRRVREAVHLAVDRQALVDQLYAGYARPTVQMVSPNVFGFSPDLEQVPQRDVAKARQLMADAGHADGIDLILQHRLDRTEVKLLQEQLAEAGIRVRAEAFPWKDMYARLQQHNVPFYLGGWVSSSGEASDLLDRKVHSYQPDRGYGTANSNQYANSELDEVIEQASAAASMEERADLMHQASAILAEDLVLLPLFSPFDVHGVRQGVAWAPRLDSQLYVFELP